MGTHYVYCAKCEGVFSVSNEALRVLQAEGRDSSPLSVLDRVHRCCSEPSHYWVFQRDDISELIFKALGEGVG